MNSLRDGKEERIGLPIHRLDEEYLERWVSLPLPENHSLEEFGLACRCQPVDKHLVAYVETAVVKFHLDGIVLDLNGRVVRNGAGCRELSSPV